MGLPDQLEAAIATIRSLAPGCLALRDPSRPADLSDGLPTGYRLIAALVGVVEDAVNTHGDVRIRTAIAAEALFHLFALGLRLIDGVWIGLHSRLRGAVEPSVGRPPVTAVPRLIEVPIPPPGT